MDDILKKYEKDIDTLTFMGQRCIELTKEELVCCIGLCLNENERLQKQNLHDIDFLNDIYQAN